MGQRHMACLCTLATKATVQPTRRMFATPRSWQSLKSTLRSMCCKCQCCLDSLALFDSYLLVPAYQMRMQYCSFFVGFYHERRNQLYAIRFLQDEARQNCTVVCSSFSNSARTTNLRT